MNSSGYRIIFIQATTVLLASLALVISAVLVAERADDRTDDATRYSRAAINAALIKSDIEQLIALGSQESIQALVANQGTTISAVPVQVIIEARNRLAAVVVLAQEIDQLVGGTESADIGANAQTALLRMDVFLANPTAETFVAFGDQMTKVRAQATELVPKLNDAAASSLDELSGMTHATRWTLIAAAIASGAVITTTTILLGKRLSASRNLLRDERDSLIATTRIMDRRNRQFQALYHVVTEVTESLSTRYVVNTAVREARKLVDADLVALRLLHADELAIAGIENSSALNVESLRTIPLGTGFSGASAKRGKTIRVTENAGRDMADEESVAAIQSGIVVPLIVGARVVGTLGCWSLKVDHFSEDDERILEMMASQVATAVAAAGSHEVSEKNAHMDALTNLANRRQLAEDVSSYFANKVLNQEPHTIAMVDIDNFGLFNKDFGHRIGDITLQKVAHMLKNTLRERDRVYRYGGEEFLIAFDGSLIESLDVAERLRKAVAETPLTGENLEPIGPITISMGIAAFPIHGDGFEAVTERADEALRAAKRLGRNRVILWTPELAAAA